MELLTHGDFNQLVAFHQAPAVSIYLPTHVGGNQARQNSIRLKNLLREAQEQLVSDYGLRKPDAEKLLSSAKRLLEDEVYWKHLSQGLALFAGKDHSAQFRLPVAFEERLVIGERFHLSPLLTLLQDEGRFYLLSVSQNRVRIFQGTRFTMVELEPKNFPTSLQEILRVKQFEKHMQSHTGERGVVDRPGGGDVIMHGQGTPEEDAKKDLLDFFHKIDRGLQKVLAEERVPMVFAGVEYLFPIYKEANSYDYLVEEPVTGNPDDLSAKELHGRAWKVVQPVFARNRHEAAQEFGRLNAQGHGSTKIEEILLMAHDGGVQALFVAGDAEQWGKFDPDSRSVELHDRRGKDSEELLNLTAIFVIEHGGEVFLVDSKDVPEEGVVAASFRYEPASLPTRPS